MVDIQAVQGLQDPKNKRVLKRERTKLFELEKEVVNFLNNNCKEKVVQPVDCKVETDHGGASLAWEFLSGNAQSHEGAVSASSRSL